MISDKSPGLMARDLVTLYSDIGFIIAHVKREFGRAPSREVIEKLRATFLADQASKHDRRNAVLSDEKRGSDKRRQQIAAAAARRYRARRAAA